MAMRIEAIETRIERLDESLQSFVSELHQLLKAEMTKHLWYVPHIKIWFWLGRVDGNIFVKEPTEN